MSDEEMSVQQFWQRCVEPMGEESDHVHIVALTDALQAQNPPPFPPPYIAAMQSTTTLLSSVFLMHSVQIPRLRR